MHRRLLRLFLLFVLASAAAFAQYGSNSQPGVKLRGRSFADLYASQKVLLSNYCRLDFEGARLDAAGWNRFKPFTSLRVNPEFNRIIVVTLFNIEIPEQPREQVSVNYQEVGFYDEGEGYTALSNNDRADFRVQEESGILLVTGMNPTTPHVSPRAAIAWMNARIADPKTTEIERAHLKDAISQLNKFVQPHPASTPAGF